MNNAKIVLIMLVLALLLAGAWSTVSCAPFSKCPWQKCTGNKCGSEKAKKATLTFVGAWDTADDWKNVITKFRQYEISKRNIDVTVQYEQLDKDNYEPMLLDRMINKQSPDIFMIYNTWLPKYQQRIVEMPTSIMTMDEFEKYFPSVAKSDLVADDKIYSLPLYVDTLALYYNKDMLLNAGFIEPPKTWDEFANYVEKLTQIDKNGNIQRMGAAIGGSDRVIRSQDILMLLVMQNNLKTKESKNPISFRTPEAERAVKFYTDFADPTKRFYTWDYNNKTYSVDAFTQGLAAMDIGYSYEVADIQKKTNGNLNYAIAPMPQQYPDNKINYANYWTPVVSKDASCTQEKGVTVDCKELAWDFISFAAQADNVMPYLESTGRAGANLIVAKKQAAESGSKVSTFASQVLTARSWNNVSNDKNDQTLIDMIDSVITTDKAKKKDVETAIADAVSAIKELY